MPAFKLAKLHGFKYISADIRFTSDHQAVILGDTSIDRTSTGSGEIVNMTFAEARSYDYGSWFNPSFANTTIPTYEEFIKFCKINGVHPYIVLQGGTESELSGLVIVAKRYGMFENTTWVSFMPQHLQVIKNTDGRARIGYATQIINADAISAVTALRNEYNDDNVFIYSSSHTDADVELCVNAAIPLELWGVDDIAEASNIPLYVSAVGSMWVQTSKLLIQNQ